MRLMRLMGLSATISVGRKRNHGPLTPKESPQQGKVAKRTHKVRTDRIKGKD
jgi:hypothetical protein